MDINPQSSILYIVYYKPCISQQSQCFNPKAVSILITSFLIIHSLIASASQLSVLTLDTASSASIEAFMYACTLCKLAM